jgi:hypothetical protein
MIIHHTKYYMRNSNVLLVSSLKQGRLTFPCKGSQSLLRDGSLAASVEITGSAQMTS